jgi:hypothetical protein
MWLLLYNGVSKMLVYYAASTAASNLFEDAFPSDNAIESRDTRIHAARPLA